MLFPQSAACLRKKKREPGDLDVWKNTHQAHGNLRRRRRRTQFVSHNLRRYMWGLHSAQISARIIFCFAILLRCARLMQAGPCAVHLLSTVAARDSTKKEAKRRVCGFLNGLAPRARNFHSVAYDSKTWLGWTRARASIIAFLGGHH